VVTRYMWERGGGQAVDLVVCSTTLHAVMDIPVRAKQAALAFRAYGIHDAFAGRQA
jgi:hypothetical protein